MSAIGTKPRSYEVVPSMKVVVRLIAGVINLEQISRSLKDFLSWLRAFLFMQLHIRMAINRLYSKQIQGQLTT